MPLGQALVLAACLSLAAVELVCTVRLVTLMLM